MPSIHKVLVPTLAASVLLVACGGSSNSSTKSGGSSAPAGSASAATVSSATNSSLGTTVLVDSKGMTLYRLSGETNGHWICTSAACTGIWRPLTLAGGAAPTGSVSSLGSVKRPDGSSQATYNGEPLYTYSGDTQAGQANGQGIKDVGTWNAVSPAGSATSAPPANSAPAPAPSGSGNGGGGYGY